MWQNYPRIVARGRHLEIIEMEYPNRSESIRHSSTRQFAEILGVHEESVRRWVRSRRLHGIKAGSQWRVPESELERIKRAGGV